MFRRKLPWIFFLTSFGLFGQEFPSEKKTSEPGHELEIINSDTKGEADAKTLENDSNSAKDKVAEPSAVKDRTEKGEALDKKEELPSEKELTEEEKKELEREAAEKEEKLKAEREARELLEQKRKAEKRRQEKAAEAARKEAERKQWKRIFWEPGAWANLTAFTGGTGVFSLSESYSSGGGFYGGILWKSSRFIGIRLSFQTGLMGVEQSKKWNARYANQNWTVSLAQVNNVGLTSFGGGVEFQTVILPKVSAFAQVSLLANTLSGPDFSLSGLGFSTGGGGVYNFFEGLSAEVSFGVHLFNPGELITQDRTYTVDGDARLFNFYTNLGVRQTVQWK